jgi:hypothetical protein
VTDTVTLYWLPHDYSWESAGAEDGRLLGDRGRVVAKWPEELLGVITACRLRGVRLVFEPDKSSDAVAASCDPAVWDAVNEYAAACGGDTGVVTVRRMDAVARVERAIAKHAGSGGGVKGGAGAHAGARRPDQHEVCDSDFDDAAAAELCKEIAEEHRRDG